MKKNQKITVSSEVITESADLATQVIMEEGKLAEDFKDTIKGAFEEQLQKRTDSMQKLFEKAMEEKDEQVARDKEALKEKLQIRMNRMQKRLEEAMEEKDEKISRYKEKLVENFHRKERALHKKYQDLEETALENLESIEESHKRVELELENETSEHITKLVKTQKKNIAKMRSRLNEQMEEELESYKNMMAEQQDRHIAEIDKLAEDYAIDLMEKTGIMAICDQGVAEWMEENRLLIEADVINRFNQDGIAVLRGLFEKYSLEPPTQDAIEIIETLEEDNDALKQKFQDFTSKAKKRIKLLEDQLAISNATRTRKDKEEKKRRIFESMTSSLAKTDIVQLRGLTENIKYEDDASYKAAIKKRIDSYTRRNGAKKIRVVEDNVLKNKPAQKVLTSSPKDELVNAVNQFFVD